MATAPGAELRTVTQLMATASTAHVKVVRMTHLTISHLQGVQVNCILIGIVSTRVIALKILFKMTIHLFIQYIFTPWEKDP